MELISNAPTLGRSSLLTSLPRKVGFDVRQAFAFSLVTLSGCMAPFPVDGIQTCQSSVHLYYTILEPMNVWRLMMATQERHHSSSSAQSVLLIRKRPSACNHGCEVDRRQSTTGFMFWETLKVVFRHDLSRHGDVVCAIAVITQIAINQGAPLFRPATEIHRAAMAMMIRIHRLALILMWCAFEGCWPSF